MNRSMINASNTMNQLQKQLDLISNNMANINTTSFKRREASFGSLLYQQFQNQSRLEEEVGRVTPNGIRQGVGAKLSQTQLNMSQGAIINADRPLDIALTKNDQFLKVMVDVNGVLVPRYTRDGAMYLSPLEDNSGQSILVTAEGSPVLDENDNFIYIDDHFKDLTISDNGMIKVTQDNGQTATYNLHVVQVKRPQVLLAKGNNQFELPQGVDQADILTALNGNLREEIGIKQYALEGSNVDLSKEMSELLITQRSYQFNAKSISIADQMMGLVNGIR